MNNNNHHKTPSVLFS